MEINTPMKFIIKKKLLKEYMGILIKRNDLILPDGLSECDYNYVFEFLSTLGNVMKFKNGYLDYLPDHVKNKNFPNVNFIESLFVVIL